MTPKFQIGDMVRKIKGSQWQGRVVGTYSTDLTPEGYCVESSTEKGSVQIYPAAVLEFINQTSYPSVYYNGQIICRKCGKIHRAGIECRMIKIL